MSCPYKIKIAYQLSIFSLMLIRASPLCDKQFTSIKVLYLVKWFFCSFLYFHLVSID